MADAFVKQGRQLSYTHYSQRFVSARSAGLVQVHQQARELFAHWDYAVQDVHLRGRQFVEACACCRPFHVAYPTVSVLCRGAGKHQDCFVCPALLLLRPGWVRGGIRSPRGKDKSEFGPFRLPVRFHFLAQRQLAVVLTLRHCA